MSNSASALQEKLQSLVTTYTKQLPGELSEIEKAWQHLQNGWNHEDLEVLLRMLHSLTGTGKTFGFAELSIKSRILEQNLKHLSQSNNVIEDADYLEINRAYS